LWAIEKGQDIGNVLGIVFIRVHLSKEAVDVGNILRMQHALFERQKIWQSAAVDDLNGWI